MQKATMSCDICLTRLTHYDIYLAAEGTRIIMLRTMARWARLLLLCRPEGSILLCSWLSRRQTAQWVLRYHPELFMQEHRAVVQEHQILFCEGRTQMLAAMAQPEPKMAREPSIKCSIDKIRSSALNVRRSGISCHSSCVAMALKQCNSKHER